MSVSFVGTTVSFDNGNTQTYTNGQTTAVNTDMSVVTSTMGSLRLSYAAGGGTEDSDTDPLEDQLSVRYSMGSMTLGAMLNEGSSTTTEFKKTEDYASFSLSVDF